MIRHKAVRSLMLAFVAVMGTSSSAAEEENKAAELYGHGVHAYFAGDMDQAVQLLDEAIAQNNADPRAYYFRALAIASRDGLSAAADLFAVAADVEFNPRDERLYDVNGALQRVQGRMRLVLEERRAAVRQAVAAEKARQNQIKYESLRRREDIVLYQPERPAKPIQLDLPSMDLGGDDPFSTGEAFTGGKEVAVIPAPVVTPSAGGQRDTGPAQVAAEEDAERDPFGPPPAADDDPFGNVLPANKAPSPAATQAEAVNPFGDDLMDVAPDDPVFDATVRPKLIPGADLGGSLIDLLGRTLSGQSNADQSRDPFDSTPAADLPAEKPPAAEASPEQPAEPVDNPFD